MDGKIKTRARLEKTIHQLKRQGKKIAFTNGCFDILHYGHLKYLEDAKAKADVLVVGLNSDASIKRIKGASRPINRQADRARMLEALSAVDYITIFSEDTPFKLIQVLKPDILIKGRDWSVRKIVGADFVRASGGRVITVPYLKGYSTTGLIEKIKNNC
ncbi:D-glycero-beta-D-manno-heptose 1-phosphate adenylyltransferase [bacterium]|nr:MAG: D-glycero-beta-D-manno-heptose 1-phosphate adenylyltransferase [bacterium]